MYLYHSIILNVHVINFPLGFNAFILATTASSYDLTAMNTLVISEFFKSSVHACDLFKTCLTGMSLYFLVLNGCHPCYNEVIFHPSPPDTIYNSYKYIIFKPLQYLFVVTT